MAAGHYQATISSARENTISHVNNTIAADPTSKLPERLQAERSAPDPGKVVLKNSDSVLSSDSDPNGKITDEQET